MTGMYEEERPVSKKYERGQTLQLNPTEKKLDV